MNTETGIRWLRWWALSAGRGLLLAAMAPAGVFIFVSVVLSIGLIPVGVGLALAPTAIAGLRGFAQTHRRWVGQWWGVRIPPPYRSTGLWSALGDPATWRDLLWCLLNVPIGIALGVIPTALAVWGVVLIVWPSEGILSPLGLAPLALSAVGAATLLIAHSRFTTGLLGPANRALAERVDALARSRAATVDASAAEVRRIERDLHDGAQARLAAVGLTIGLAEQLVHDDPAAAAALLAEAREVNGQALADLRHLVRGIHPPALAERGLCGAVEALAASLPLPVEVAAEGVAGLAAPVESAAYFAVAEALANAAKHGRAGRAWVHMRRLGDRLTAVVGDDGVGGASLGDGLQGIARRLAAFDGALTLTSPTGGPTVVVIELPCASGAQPDPWAAPLPGTRHTPPAPAASAAGLGPPCASS